MRNLRFVSLVAVALLVVGCGTKRVDSSSDEKFKESLQAVKETLNASEKEEFETAVATIVFSEMGNVFSAMADPEGVKRRGMDRLDGKTAAEIIAEGKRLQAEQEKREAEQEAEAEKELAEMKKQMAGERRRQVVGMIEEAEQELAELREKRQAAEQAKTMLRQFRVSRSRFAYSKDGYVTKPMIELTVRNGTGQAVSRAYFEGTLSTPGRSVPWVKDSFNYSIPGGLEPGEQATWRLAPNMFGEWSKAPRDRNDMVLTVTTCRLDGADGEAMLDAEFPEYEQQREEALKRRLPELRQDLAELDKQLAE